MADFRPGYPIDLRRADQRARAEHSPIGDLEWKVGRVVARFTGEPVYLQDDGSRDGMVDIKIAYSDRQAAYLEVTSNLEPGYAAIWSELMKGGQIPQITTMANLRRKWSITLSGASHQHWRPLHAELPVLLANLEANGMTFQRVATVETLKATQDSSVIRLLKFGVVQLCSAPSEAGQGAAAEYPAGISGPTARSWPTFLDWVSETLASAKLANKRDKLIKTGAPERHIFIGITYTSPEEVFFGLTVGEQGLPTAAPTLPPEITHLWLWNIEGGDRCITWSPDQGWSDVMSHWATD
jgi:hypothetical protein